jgi:hypothetical protein
MGRPTIFSQELADAICERIANGETLRSLCSDPAMPAWGTLWRWTVNNAAFAAQYTRAREDAADWHADRALDAALDVDGSQSSEVAAARLKWDALRWHAGKCAPKRWGEKVQQEISGPGGTPVQTNLTVEFVRPAVS